MKTIRAIRCVLFAALFLLASVLVVDTVLADVPVVNSVKPWTRASDNHVILNITVTHRNYYTGHYVDYVQVDIDGAIDTTNLSPPQPVNQAFVVEYDMGVISTNPTVRARAHCTLHGSSIWSASVKIGGGNGDNGGDGGDGGPIGGLVNPNATFSADLTLLLQIAVFLVFLAGFVLVKARRDYAKHGAIMGVAIVLHTVSILMVMVPSLLSSGGLFENLLGSLQLAILAHATLGILVEILGLYVVLAWALHYRDVKPCFKRKIIMRVLAILWTIALILGVYVYILFYVPI
jgi:uncharacterized membrane protein YozB (DUF420 family)/desulfoferrodoxin (superoxide reductase-like protein)